MTLFAVVPVMDLTGTKSRLKPVLNPFGRAGLTVYMMKNVLAALQAAEVDEGSLAVISPDAAGRGTNALLLRPPDALPFLFGANSFENHLDAAREREVQVQVCERTRLAFDIDTAEDLAEFGERHTSARMTDREQPAKGLQVLPVEGIPEVHPGDDVAGHIVRAAEDD